MENGDVLEHINENDKQTAFFACIVVTWICGDDVHLVTLLLCKPECLSVYLGHCCFVLPVWESEGKCDIYLFLLACLFLKLVTDTTKI